MTDPLIDLVACVVQAKAESDTATGAESGDSLPPSKPPTAFGRRLTSVNDCLPAHDGKYLVWRSWKSSGIGSWGVAFYFTEDESWLDDSTAQDAPPIRHWCQLPQPPVGYHTRSRGEK
jgi:hypothetical protein